ncbi:phospho-N-acetylmuramoyl-pentapeptide-transferase [Rhizohabitans arisaemae]|uniref:phospho-N-acetylmuramoyl-pentapeptide- transferase n=1 Tax=Rhizohabitans arisaemae TaxID=2720610 RepID=UPI0024B1E181|nr:phospho-N-acetylmuramoyl-pentapeptide-transferase [Rhizohabitans arisaemae]
MRDILVAGAVALFIALLCTPLAIRLFSRRGYGQNIRDEGPSGHHEKRGTPTMGGTVIIVGALIGYAVAHLATWTPPTVSALLVLFLMTGLGLVGFLDDFIKIYKRRSLGLRSGAKFTGQVIIGVIFAVLVVRFPNGYGTTPAIASISFLRDFLPIGLPLFIVWTLLFIAGFSNAVNLTDGLDGLASGAACMTLGAYVLVGNWQLRNGCAPDGLGDNCYWVRDPLDLAVVAAAVLGACFGFLWWNAPPAKIFMGDTGSLAIGGVLAGLAITTRTQLLLIVLGGLFVIITLSVMIQVGSFKMTGRRVFKMAPLQHHFELSGWAETTIVVRFWLIAAMCIALGLGIFYVEWMPKP